MIITQTSHVFFFQYFDWFLCFDHFFVKADNLLSALLRLVITCPEFDAFAAIIYVCHLSLLFFYLSANLKQIIKNKAFRISQNSVQLLCTGIPILKQKYSLFSSLWQQVLSVVIWPFRTIIKTFHFLVVKLTIFSDITQPWKLWLTVVHTAACPEYAMSANK